MEDYLPDAIAEVCVRVKGALKQLPDPSHTSREEFFAVDNLWKIEIPSTCEQAVEYVRGVMLLIDEGLNRPAAALSRSVHECCIRFHYLSVNEDELPDWFKWQMSHDYHATRDTLCNYVVQGAADEQRAQRLREEIKHVGDFLGEAPRKQKYPWKSARSMLQDVTSSLGPEAHGPLYRQLIADPSDYVHVYVSGRPPWASTMRLTEISFAATIKRAMQLCTSKQLLSPTAAEIEALCDQVLQTTVAP